MLANSPKPEFDNAAWVRIKTNLDVKTLFEFCQQVERLFRLNPYLIFNHWQQNAKTSITAVWENHSNKKVYQIDTCIELEIKDNEICAKYQSGVKSETYFIVEPSGQSADLVIIDRYRSSGNDSLDEVDKSIHAWGKGLHKFFKQYSRLRHIPYSEYIIDKYWIRLTPMARRIIYILLVVTAVEIIALVLLVLILANH
ncbi:MAG: hypothetical protein R8G33_10595 [Gammaproteobacteria bacterium]|nr:hypothetical protein [Gammaproteobacteria bacterium]